MHLNPSAYNLEDNNGLWEEVGQLHLKPWLLFIGSSSTLSLGLPLGIGVCFDA
jgi:hypothetical protein